MSDGIASGDKDHQIVSPFAGNSRVAQRGIQVNERNAAVPVGRFAKVRGGALDFHYHEFGARSAGRPTLLFLHGSGPGASGYSNFRHNWPEMVEAGYHALVVDYIGFGFSSKPKDFAYTNKTQVSILDEFLVQQGVDSIVPIGNSLGGYLSLQYALTYPDKVAKLILMAPGGVEDVSLWVPNSPGLRAMGAAINSGKPFDRESFRALLKLIVKDEAHLTDQVIDERLPIAQAQPKEVWSTQEFTPISQLLGQIQVPVLGFWGYHDQFVPARHAFLMQERIPDCRVIVSNRAGHWFMIEEPELFNEACLRFLAER